jgi:hypothetical protein
MGIVRYYRAIQTLCSEDSLIFGPLKFYKSARTLNTMTTFCEGFLIDSSQWECFCDDLKPETLR